MDKRLFILAGLLLTLLACNIGTSTPTPTTDLFATLSASTPLGANPTSLAEPVSSATFSPIFSTPIPPTAPAVVVPTSSSADPPKGRIVYTCDIFKSESSGQVCIINADGTGFRRLTTEDKVQHNFPSLSPDGGSVVYSARREAKFFEIYEMNLASGKATQLTNKLGGLGSPEISPDGKSIIFRRMAVNTGKNFIWWMKRNGDDADRIMRFEGWEPTWSPDGEQVLFVSNMDGPVRLFRSRPNGRELQKVGSLSVGGRADWSPDGQWITAYAGDPGNREIYIMTADGLNPRVISPAGGNSREPSFSPDGQWIAFTAYYDRLGDADGCEIYVMRTNGADLRRVTNNDYCDSQPRWGQ